MPRSIEAVIDAQGNVTLREEVHLLGRHRAIVTILDESVADEIPQTALLSEPALAIDWDLPQEDEAWSHLQQDR